MYPDELFGQEEDIVWDKFINRINELKEAFDLIAWMAEKYVEGSGLYSQEKEDFERAMRIRND